MDLKKKSQGILAVVALAIVTSPLAAHGGQYRGPTDNGPASPSSNSGTGSKGSGSSSPSGSNSGSNGTSGSSSGSSSSAPSSSGSSSSGRGLPRGVQIEPDPVGWETWWEFQKDPLVRLRESFLTRAVLPEDAMLGPGGRAVRTIEPPTPTDIRAVVVPALHRALRSATDRDTVTGCMVALAKIGQDVPGARPGDVFRQHLRSKDQEVRETAALCLGLDPARSAADIGLLVDIVLDRAEGRAAADRSEMDERTRAFAAYGLGVALADGAEVDRIVDALLFVLASPTTSRNLTVASIAALAQLDPSAQTGRQRERVLLGIEAFYSRPLGPGEQLLQAHCPTAIARLTGREGASAARLRERFAKDLESSLAAQSGERSNNHLAQSCAIALGLMAEPWNVGDKAAAIPELLLSCYRNHRDHQTRYFAILSLGRLGGDAARAALLRELAVGNRTIEQPWIALALGLFEHGRRGVARESGGSSDADQEIGSALLTLLGKARSPSSIGGAALAVGLAGVPASGDRLRTMLRDNAAREDLAGPIAISLAIQDERRAAVDLHELLPRCVRRPQLLVQVATALGRLGDGEVVPQLTAMLGDGDNGLARLAAVAGAIGQIGDRNCIPPLVALLADEKAIPLARAFAAVALGGVCDPAPLPWNARFAYSVNYRAAVETLTDGSSGVLDIL